jgi:hypothetical protein
MAGLRQVPQRWWAEDPVRWASQGLQAGGVGWRLQSQSPQCDELERILGGTLEQSSRPPLEMASLLGNPRCFLGSEM